MSQDVFQMRMDQITDRLSGVIASHDDICIYGKTQEQHNKHLLQLLKIASKNGLVFNSRNVNQKSTNHLLWNNLLSTRKEIRSHEDTGITRPSNTTETQTQTQLQSFLGLVNYLQQFLLDIAAKMTTFLREQVSQ